MDNAEVKSGGRVRRVFAVAALVGSGLAVAIGCGPMPKPVPPPLPEAPKARFENIEEATVSPVTLNANRSGDYGIGRANTIALMSFQGQGSGAGSLVADSFILDLQRRGYQVVEREKVEQIIKEQARIGQGMTDLSDVEIARRVGRIVHADYFLVGAVTEYASESRNVPLSKVVLDSDAERYNSDLDTYNRKKPEFDQKCETYLRYSQYPQPCTFPKALTLDEWREEYYKQSRQVLASVARVGLTAKLIDVSSTQILWVGQANVADSNLQKGMTRITSKMIDSFVGK